MTKPPVKLSGVPSRSGRSDGRACTTRRRRPDRWLVSSSRPIGRCENTSPWRPSARAGVRAIGMWQIAHSSSIAACAGRMVDRFAPDRRLPVRIARRVGHHRRRARPSRSTRPRPTASSGRCGTRGSCRRSRRERAAGDGSDAQRLAAAVGHRARPDRHGRRSRDASPMATIAIRQPSNRPPSNQSQSK